MTRALISRVVFSQHADFQEIQPCERLHVHFLSDCSSNPYDYQFSLSHTPSELEQAHQAFIQLYNTSML
jgi:hypothetical protein